MTEYLIGTGGWAYFKVPNKPSLNAYSEVFNFVEVNNTFYTMPSLEEVKSWYQRVPQDFHFTVKCYRQISHYQPLESSESNFQIMDRMKAICKTLKAVGLVIQTPSRFIPTTENLTMAENFFAHFTDAEFDLIWEPRGLEWTAGPVKENLTSILMKNGITHCTDISKAMPLHSANISYTRIFGLGEKNQWQFDDQEIKLLHDRALELPQTAYITFHTQRQTHDAARLKAFDETGRLINTTGKYEVNSMIVAIDEYRKYPISKQELLAAHGWKIIDMTKDTRIRASEILNQLPNIEFKTKKELKFYLERLFRGKGQKKLEVSPS